MKIIFDSEDEKEKFIQSMANAETCPSAMLLEELIDCMGCGTCLKCWRFATNRSNITVGYK
ncbi:hypothetical protein [Murimonas intestini]|uniref:4Fe-4S ferredoxin-type domain-containing protein n=1 Tax=Murimonas intestini TaxID=1337051 RepID=A0AB73SZF5_9FIRM|nr:hypothetical protein [Murimonas intestini]MCR1842775.1 hypothetical protein [Murimonas intestini]MCR1867886.1 hypothetical protein [Murimonas intestini]MCR1885238.1 hypothetical protein [Murimonas intestini]